MKAAALPLLTLAACAAAPRAGYPSRPVRVVVGFIPGSAADITGRLVGNGLSRIFGQQFVVENKPGAGSSLAAESAARAAKDGHTLYLGTSATLANLLI